MKNTGFSFVSSLHCLRFLYFRIFLSLTVFFTFMFISFFFVTLFFCGLTFNIALAALLVFSFSSSTPIIFIYFLFACFSSLYIYTFFCVYTRMQTDMFSYDYKRNLLCYTYELTWVLMSLYILTVQYLLYLNFWLYLRVFLYLTASAFGVFIGLIFHLYPLFTRTSRLTVLVIVILWSHWTLVTSC